MKRLRPATHYQYMQSPTPRSAEQETPAALRILRFPHLLGGSVAFRSLPAETRLQYARGDVPRARKGCIGWLASLCRRIVRRENAAPLRPPPQLAFDPPVPKRRKPFSIRLAPAGRNLADITLVRFEIRFPSGTTRRIDYVPPAPDPARSFLEIGPFQSDDAGDFYVSSRTYFSDGSAANDARIIVLLSENPDQVVISPQVWLVSTGYGRVEFDWDVNEFHCRAYATVTNGSSVTRTYHRVEIRITDSGLDGPAIAEFAFDIGPWSLEPGGIAYRMIDTAYGPASPVWDKFNQFWDLTVQFTYVADGDVRISDYAAYRPMMTVLINSIDTTEFTAGQAEAEGTAVIIASEILEQQGFTLYDPYWRILSNQADRDRFSIIDIGWTDGKYDRSEARAMYSEISGPEEDRIDVFLPLSFGYTPEVPADQQNLAGFSTVGGPFPKDGDPPRSGCLVLMNESDHEFFGVGIAHELCHYLGLGHSLDSLNLMEETGGEYPHEITWDQLKIMKQHGMMKWLADDI
jgi:hypothetical protein